MKVRVGSPAVPIRFSNLFAVAVALALFSALLGSCGGGGESGESATVAVSFCLDEISPAMAAYIGNPSGDPFELPPGRYYVEALVQGDVLISLGAVDIEDGGAVDFPASFGDAGGVVDPERAGQLVTIAGFLVDIQLAKYEYLGVITGGFTKPPSTLPSSLIPTALKASSGCSARSRGRGMPSWRRSTRSTPGQRSR
jgi:hypothetical protein